MLNLKQLRIDSGLKTSKVAEELGISRTHLYNLEKGINKVDKLKKEKLSYLYRVPMEVIENAIRRK